MPSGKVRARAPRACGQPAVVAPSGRWLPVDPFLSLARDPAAVATWENAWERFTPFLGFPPELRRIIYTTNAIVILSLR